MASLRTVVALVCVLAAVANAESSICVDSNNAKNLIKNGGFEAQTIAGTQAPNFQYVPQVTDWVQNSKQGIVLGKNGNTPWGGLSSDKGNQFLILQGWFRSIEQTVTGLNAGRKYELSFLTAGRPGNTGELMEVLVNGKPQADIFENIVKFERHIIVVTPDDQGTITIKFRNTSPAGRDLSVFVDDVILQEQRDCGDGASCTVVDSDYVCKCTDNLYDGKDVTNAKATCQLVSATIDEVQRALFTLDDRESESTEILEDAVARIDGRLNASVDDLSSRVYDLETNYIKLKAKVDILDSISLTDLQALANKNKDDIAGIKTTADSALQKASDNQDSLESFKSALKSATVSISPVSSGSSSVFTPEVGSTDDGNIQISIVDDGHVMVNDDAVLVESEVNANIKKSLEAVMKELADAL